MNIQLIGTGGGYVGEASILVFDPLPRLVIWEGRYFVLDSEPQGHPPIYRLAIWCNAYRATALTTYPSLYD